MVTDAEDLWTCTRCAINYSAEEENAVDGQCPRCGHASLRADAARPEPSPLIAASSRILPHSAPFARPVTMPPTFGSAKLCKSGEDVVARPVPQAGELADELRAICSCSGDFICAKCRAADLLTSQAARIAELESIDREAASHVESIICMRSKHFTGESPYVGWKGLGLALTHDYDTITAQAAEIGNLKDDYLRRHKDACDRWERIREMEAAIAAKDAEIAGLRRGKQIADEAVWAALRRGQELEAALRPFAEVAGGNTLNPLPPDWERARAAFAPAGKEPEQP